MLYGILVTIDYISSLETFSTGVIKVTYEMADVVIKVTYEMADVVVSYFVFKLWDRSAFEYATKSSFAAYAFKIEDFIPTVILWYIKTWSLFPKVGS